MAIRVDTTSWIPGAILVGDTGFGVLGSEVPSTGDNGAGYLYNDLTLPADEVKEVCGRITSWPSAGTLYAYEDSSFTFIGAPDGSYSFEYQRYVDGVETGLPVPVTLNVGEGIISIPAASLTLTGYAPDVVTSSSSNAIDIPSAQLTITGHAPTVAIIPFTPEQLAYMLAYIQENLMIWDEPIEGGKTAAQMMRIMAAALAGTSTKAGNTITFKGIDGTTDRIVGSFDSENNRTGAVLDGS